MSINNKRTAEFTLRTKRNAVLKRNDLSYNGIDITKRIYRECAKRNILTDVKFINTQILRSAFAGSLLKKVKFIDTKMAGNAWTYCVFTDCEFMNEQPQNRIGSNFSNSSFYNCTFKNIIFAACSFIKTQFINCKFENCIIASSTFEDAIFQDCNFYFSDIGSTNLEFCEFRNCRISDSILPLYQICYVINGIEHVIDRQNSIFLRSNNGLYSLDDLYGLCERMIDYYTLTKQFFALANTLVILKDYETIRDKIFDGINYYLANKNFRMIKHLCRLGKSKGVLDIHQSKSILDLIDNFLITQKSNPEELSSYVMHSADLRAMLYDYNGTNSILTIEIQTSILPEEAEKANSLMLNISNLIDEHSDVNHNMQIRHNSPFLIFCTVVGAVASLIAISEAVVKLGVFAYKKLNKKHNGKDDDDHTSPSSPATITYNISGNVNININGDNNLSNYAVNNDINTMVNKLITPNGVAVTKIENDNKKGKNS